ncbi:hypothetical protein DUI87_21681 [Hirundo rustica rustica]|uniref:Uncharacterized protein n=1 Tax=Hirundo rustica rustica TaxID=333673 RepID=A0A3M0JKQ4_HIRRU|nr:hypothetical protein DUI87_21681 [Hirundo rustica rustica]
MGAILWNPEGGWALEAQSSGHSTKADRAQEAFGQGSQAHGETLRVSSAGPGAGLNNPDGTPPDQDIL